MESKRSMDVGFSRWLLFTTELLFVLSVCIPQSQAAEFPLNFTAQTATSNMKASVVNVACINGVSDNGHHRTSDTPGCGQQYFKQELVSDGVNQYYHVIIGDPAVDDFAQEYYIRTVAGYWWAMGPGIMYGYAPYSASWGDTGKLLSSAFYPLAPATLSGNGTGNPNRVYMKQVNKDPQMLLTFTKQFEARKPNIHQTVNDGGVLSEFDMAMEHATYNESVAGIMDNKVTVYDQGKPLGVGSFDLIKDGDSTYVSAGRYTYETGTMFDGAYGAYHYDLASFDQINLKWLTYCEDVENPDRGCVGGPGPGGSGPGGPGDINPGPM